MIARHRVNYFLDCFAFQFPQKNQTV